LNFSHLDRALEYMISFENCISFLMRRLNFKLADFPQYTLS
jgi:hypothetical protein